MSTPCNPPFTSFYLPFLDWLQPPLCDHGPITAENHTLDVTYSRRKKIQNIFSNQQLLSMIHLQRTAEQDYACGQKSKQLCYLNIWGVGYRANSQPICSNNIFQEENNTINKSTIKIITDRQKNKLRFKMPCS